ncbi:antibiotic biosynthesis monooxygenase family protein [Staphylococcus hyicus]|uniref:antibiotic biosynthesis monooxygenase family protein n=1 Tax=Staphylococcus hyicus TaxID=1284 RepID=UPI002365E4C0|nr:antibiotic biosynthesis monooxygenase family protein [Staphylococcus hyicus]
MHILDINKNYRIRFEDAVYIDKNNETIAYETLQKVGNSKDKCYVVLNYIKILSGKSDEFETECLSKDSGMEDLEGFHSYYFLKPIGKVDHYLVVTLWKDAHFFDNWIQSKKYLKAFNEIVDCDIVNRQLTYRISFYDQNFKRT